MPLYTKAGSKLVTANKMQIGVKRQVPIYGTTTVTKPGPVCNYINLSKYFTYTQGSSYGWTLSENTSSVKLVPQNFGINSSTATITLTATRNISNLVITGAYYTESGYDKITLTVAGSTKLSAVSGTSALATRVSGVSITKGQTVIFTYAKDGSSHASSETSTYFTLTCDPYTETVTENVITGYEEKLLPANVIGAWIFKDGATRQFFGGLKYTGTHTITEITDQDGSKYELYTLTDSGILTLTKPTKVWLCGGGGGGGTGTKSGTSYTSLAYSGGGGAGAFIKAGQLNAGKYTINVGTGGIGTSGTTGAATTIYDSNGVSMFIAAGGGYGSNSGTGGNGGTGGGAGQAYSGYTSGIPTISAGTGDNIEKYPFEITTLDPHCAGGGGGTLRSGKSFRKGGSGGTNGVSGDTGSTITGNSSNGYSHSGGTGGQKGGGTGGTAGSTSSTYTAGNGAAATFYGSGGGGGAFAQSSYSASTTYKGKGGNGYQGVVYLLVPKNIEKFTVGYISYTGESTTETIEVNGETWKLMTLTDSGTLTIVDGKAKVWMCGGGGGGHGSQNGYNSAASSGGSGGGGGYVGNTRLQAGEYTITIGAGASPTYSTYTSSGSASTIESEEITLLECLGGESAYHQSSYAYGGAGGSGGGSGYYGTGYVGPVGKGAGISTYPFNIISLGAHCAGGGGGAWTFNNSDYGTDIRGGDGGSNGSDGYDTNTNPYNGNNAPGGSGGDSGGGKGGDGYDLSLAAPDGGYAGGNGTTGTFYGAGGGGGGKVTWYTGEQRQGIGGAGYQGVCYVLYQDDPNSNWMDGVGYDGTGTFSTVEMDGTTYNLLTITDSGTLNIARDDVSIWLCGGGGAGPDGSQSGTYCWGGGGGGGGYVATSTLTQGDYPVVIGAGGNHTVLGSMGRTANDGGATSVGSIAANGGKAGGTGTINNGYGTGGNGGDGGSGGGAAEGSAQGGSAIGFKVGTGAKISTVPFNLTAYFKPHSAGGGAGTSQGRDGGDGGSNGSNGFEGSWSSYVPGTGGEYGGGDGGVYHNGASDATNGTFYGAGGGGGGVQGYSTGFNETTDGGTGYQGVAYVLWPKS